MTERKWTEAQNNAIQARGGSVLVSAAAGSGKTAVLVERAVQLICDPHTPIDADRLLVVTFSRAAAAEMKQRMGERIAAMIHQQPNDLHLLRQQALLGKAQICTVDSFCLDLVRQNFQNLQISPDFSVIDQNELEILLSDCVADCIAAFYESDESGQLFDLVELLSAGRDDQQLADTILKIYAFSRSHPFFDEWLDSKLAMYATERPVAETVWGKLILAHAQENLRYCIELTTGALDRIYSDEQLEQAYGASFHADLQQLEQCAALADAADWDALVTALSGFAFERLGRVPGDDPWKQQVQDARAQVKEIVRDELAKKFLNATGAQFHADLDDLQPKISLLFAMVRDFSARLWEAKLQKKRLHFSDLEHLALELLVDRDTDGRTSPTAHAREVAQQYDYVLVDEYQDTNEVQDMIFTCISRNQKNLFMVGDVKQSIYGFRQAMPQIFLSKKRAFFPCHTGQYPAKVVLDTNFRSRPEVIGAVNAIFGGVMSDKWGEVTYDEDERLQAGASYPPASRVAPELLLIDLSAYEGNRDAVAVEAEEIAQKIRSMLAAGYKVQDGDGMRPATLRDFCILLRSPKNRVDTYMQALARHGVAAVAENAGGYLAAREVAAVVSLLRALDNPLLDVELVAAMLSPLFDFTPDDIARIRLAGRGKPFFLALQTHAAEDARCAAFLEQFSRLRARAALLPADQLLLRIYDETDALAVFQAMEMGQSRRANLLLLVEYAATYHALGYKKLGGFVGFLGRLAEKGGDLAPAAAQGEGADAVRIMSIHRSKGLEFPVVFLADAAKRFNKVDLRQNTLLHAEFGFACVRRDREVFKQYPTVPMQAIRLEAERSIVSEEMRIFYVALTRAREKLIITGTIKTNLQRALGKLAAPLQGGALPPYRVGKCQSYLDWALMVLLHLPSGQPLRELAREDDLEMLPEDVPWEVQVLARTDDEPAQTQATPERPRPDANPALLQQLRERAAWVYPYRDETRVPAKLSVSAVARQEMDITRRLSSRPRFLTAQTLTPAERGNAMHKFMQFAHYETARKDLDAEIQRMERERYLSAIECESLQRDRLRDFFTSPLAQRIFASETVYRELRFMSECGQEQLGAWMDLMGDGKIVLQGVADCVFVEDGAAVIVDYKTDRVHSADQLRERYAAQLQLYRLILSESLDLPVKECILYAFALSMSVNV